LFYRNLQVATLVGVATRVDVGGEHRMGNAICHGGASQI
jgi:hypothetical protein